MIEGATALITGGGSGIGRAVLERYHEEGANVATLDIDPDRVEAIKREFDDSVTAVQGDVTSYEANERAVTRAVEEFGGLDVFIGNAGIFDNNVRLADIDPEDLPDAFWEQYSVNVMGYLLGAKATLPYLLESEGCMIFTASYSSFYPGTGGILYTPSKHAVAGIIRQLAYELAPEIRVNGVAPGYAPTNVSGLDALGQGKSPAVPDQIDERYPLPIPQPEEYAGYYVLLGSEENSRASTGAIIEADSGLSIRGAD